MAPPTINRKRSRAHLEQEKASYEKGQTPLSSSKRRKPNNSDDNGTLVGSISNGVSKYLGWSAQGNGKENDGLEEDKMEVEDPDDFADTPPPGIVVKTSAKSNRSSQKEAKAKKDIWDLPSSEPEREQRRSVRKLGPGRSTAVSTPKTAEPLSKGKVSLKKNGGSAAADEVKEMEPDEERSSKRSSKGTEGKAGSISAKSKAVPASPTAETPIKYQHRSPGRPSKSQLLKKAKQLARQGRRANLAAREHESEEEISTQKAQNQPKVNDPPRKRGRPRKIINNLIEPSHHTPKGILTPRRGRPKGPRKSVMFEPDGELDLGFKDIPTSANTKKIEEYERAVSEECENNEQVESESDAPALESADIPESAEANSEEDPDTACEVCLKQNFTTKNPILLCDRCDSGYHLKCHDLSEVPAGDWFCKKCQPKQEVSLFPQLGPTAVESSVDTPDIEGFEDHLRCMQRIVLDNLTGHRKIKLQGFDEEMQKVHQVVEQTVMAGEGNSMLVIGARGCGKTTLVESVISNLSSHRENFHVVRLNGFIHTDNKLALKEIWRQLGREMEVEDGHTSTNHADTLATLLALLSHPSEMAESGNDQTAKSVIFILDEFDLFTTHPRQTLLYNLFDIAQAKKAPIVVLGLTAKIDVVESLEKRVKSRFSHRYVHLSLPRSLPAFWEICRAALVANLEDLKIQSLDSRKHGGTDFTSFWQKMIEDLYNKDATFKNCVQSEFYRTKSVSAFFASCILPIASLSTRNPILKGKSFASSSLSLSAPDSKLQILQGLSELELALLIAAARLDIILDTDTCNFAMAYDEYSSLTSRHKIQTSSTGVAALGASAKVWGRDVSLGAWEKLAEYELLVPAGIGGGGRDFGAAGRMWKVDVGLEEITGSVGSLSTVMTKWCREI